LDSVDLESFRKRLSGIEGKFTQHYFKQIFGLLPEKLRPERRRKFKAYDGVNNLLNLAYEVLSWKVHRAVVKAKLEPYLGFLHSVQYGKPSLVCDLQELYRHLMDDFVVGFSQSFNLKDFISKEESVSRSRRGKRQYLKDSETRRMMGELDGFFLSRVEIPAMRHGKSQAIETLIKEEALLLAKYIRDERKTWIPRITRCSLTRNLFYEKHS
ncbi:unnamed protein product, partial [marine sediment metagenome]